MSRISNETIDEILEQITPSDWQRLTGQTPRRSGTVFFIKSPFTDEKSASFCIYPGGRFKDYSSGKSGSIISFMMDRSGADFPSVIQELADQHKIIVKRDGPDVSPQERDEIQSMRDALKLAIDAYENKRRELTDDHKCMKHLKEVRQLDDLTINQFSLGYAPGDGKWLTQRLVEKGLAIPAEEIGLIRRDKDSGMYYDRIKDAIVFPIKSTLGNPVGFGVRPFSGEPKYYNSSGSRIYDKSSVLMGLDLAAKSIQLQKCAIITEGNFDVINLHRAGATNTVATCGTALTENHCKLLNKVMSHCATKRVIIMRDQDKAGRKAERRDFEILIKYNFDVQICHLPDGQDPDDFVRANFPPGVNFSETRKKLEA